MHTLRLLLLLLACWLPALTPQASASSAVPVTADLPHLRSCLENHGGRVLVRQNPWSAFDPLGLASIGDYEEQNTQIVAGIQACEKAYRNAPTEDRSAIDASISSSRAQLSRNYEAIKNIEDTAKWWNGQIDEVAAKVGNRADKADLLALQGKRVNAGALDDASDQFKTMVSEKNSLASAAVNTVAAVGYFLIGKGSGSVGTTGSRAAATESDGWVPQLMEQHQAGFAKPALTNPTIANMFKAPRDAALATRAALSPAEREMWARHFANVAAQTKNGPAIKLNVERAKFLRGETNVPPGNIMDHQ